MNEQNWKDLLKLSDAAAKAPGRPHTSTLTRWSKHGVLCGKERVYLRTTRVGGRIYVHVDDLTRFIEQLNADRPGDAAESESAVARRANEANAALERLGC